VSRNLRSQLQAQLRFFSKPFYFEALCETQRGYDCLSVPLVQKLSPAAGHLVFATKTCATFRTVRRGAEAVTRDIFSFAAELLPDR